jgi:hypothetical protein
MLNSWFRHVLSDFGPASPARSLTEEQVYFLRRLERLAGLQRDEVTWVRLNDAGQELVRRAIYSTYCDCVDGGTEQEARQVLHPENLAPNGMGRRVEHSR